MLSFPKNDLEDLGCELVAHKASGVLLPTLYDRPIGDVHVEVIGDRSRASVHCPLFDWSAVETASDGAMAFQGGRGEPHEFVCGCMLDLPKVRVRRFEG